MPDLKGLFNGAINLLMFTLACKFVWDKLTNKNAKSHNFKCDNVAPMVTPFDAARYMGEWYAI